MGRRLDKNIDHALYLKNLRNRVFAESTHEDNNNIHLARAIFLGSHEKISLLTSPERLELCPPGVFGEEDGDTLLYIAAYLGNTAIISRLIDCGCELNSFVFPADSELLGAVRADQPAAAHFLLERGSLIDPRHDGGWTPLHVACFNKSVRMIRALMGGSDWDNTEEDNHHFFTAEGSHKCAEESVLCSSSHSGATLTAEIGSSGGEKDPRMLEMGAPGAESLECTPQEESIHPGFNTAQWTVDPNIIGIWTYQPVNLLFVTFAEKEGYLTWFTEEEVILRCLKALSELSPVPLDVSYSSVCAAGNPPALQRALVMLSPTVFRFLLNHGADTDCLLRLDQKSVHDELVMFSIHSSKLGLGRKDRVERYWSCLLYLLMNGREEVSGTTLARLLLRQLAAVCLSRYPETELVFRNLIGYATKPRPLSALCVRVVRGHLSGSPMECVSQLPCPMSAQRMLLLEKVMDGGMDEEEERTTEE